jgi:hypothetical protein
MWVCSPRSVALAVAAGVLRSRLAELDDRVLPLVAPKVRGLAELRFERRAGCAAPRCWTTA